MFLDAGFRGQKPHHLRATLRTIFHLAATRAAAKMLAFSLVQENWGFIPEFPERIPGPLRNPSSFD